jgi:Zn-dependent protease
MAELSLGIGSISGVPIELHWTFILLMLLILLASAQLFLLWALLFVFVLMHELVHSWMARRHGVGVKRIVLYPLGGGTIIRNEDLTPQKEFIISISGPLASLLFGLALWIPSVYLTGPASQFLWLLALINLILGVFNILPWLPLDGGKALRSYLQRKMGYLAATKRAVAWSNAVTFIFVVGSIAYALFNQSYSYTYKAEFIIFSIAVAMFVYFGASSELGYATVKERIKDLKVRDAMSTDYDLVDPEMRIRELRLRWLKSKKGAAPHIVLFRKSGKFNVLAIGSVQKAMMKRDSDARVSDFGVAVSSIGEGAPLTDAIDAMAEDDSSIICVVRGVKAIGVLLRQKVDYVVGLHLSDGGKDNK